MMPDLSAAVRQQKDSLTWDLAGPQRRQALEQPAHSQRESLTPYNLSNQTHDVQSC